MTTVHRPVDLPDFENPPVVETLLSVQFDPLLLPKTAHFGLYWSRIRSRYPRTEEQPELPAIIEKEIGDIWIPIGIQIQSMEAPPTPRFWFIAEDENELLQVQRDRFVKNWRKSGKLDNYPRYEQVKAGFDRDFESFARFIEEERLGVVRITQCEVTYINHIPAGAGWESHSQIERVFRNWAPMQDRFPGTPDDLAFRARFPIRSEAGAFLGRLSVTVQPVTRITDRKPMFAMELTARGQIGDGTDFLNVGREWIVRSFAQLTTPSMHEIWGRIK